VTERAQRERARLSPPDKEVHRTRRRAALGYCRPRLGRALWCAEGYCRRHTHVDSLRTQVLLLCSRQANDERRWGWLRGCRVLGAGSGSRLPIEAARRDLLPALSRRRRVGRRALPRSCSCRREGGKWRHSENVGPRDDERGWSDSFLGAGRGLGWDPVYRAPGCA